MRNRQLTPLQRELILKRDNYICAYCFDPATDVDHVIPYSYIPINLEWNLVASCQTCNSIASDHVFSSFIEKYLYIKDIRHSKQKYNRVNADICPDCQFPFVPLNNNATLLLCPECAACVDLLPTDRTARIEEIKQQKQRQQAEQIKLVKTVDVSSILKVSIEPSREATHLKLLKEKFAKRERDRVTKKSPNLIVRDLRKKLRKSDKPIIRPNLTDIELLKSLYKTIFNTTDVNKKNLQSLADKLSRFMERERPWTWRYLYNLFRSYENFGMSKELKRAIISYGSYLDGEHPLIARSEVIKAYAVGDVRSGTLILGKSTHCRLCFLSFVGIVGNQKYCCKEHRLAFYKAQRKYQVDKKKKRK